MRAAGLGPSVDSTGGVGAIRDEPKVKEAAIVDMQEDKKEAAKTGERESPAGCTSPENSNWNLVNRRWTRTTGRQSNGEQGGEKLVSRDCKIWTAVDGPMDLEYHYSDAEMAIDDKVDCLVDAACSGFSSSPSSPLSIPFLRGKSDAGGVAHKPTSSDRSKINSTSPQPSQPTLPSEWSKVMPSILNDCDKLSAEEVLKRLQHIAKKLEADIAHDHWLSEEGQKELKKISEENEKSKRGLNIFDYTTSSKASLCPMSAPSQDPSNDWYEVELTADTGACDTVMPKAMCSGIPVVQSPQSLQGLEYEVATGESIPNLGQRCCELWTEGATSGKAINVQVADVHKALLSLSRCADMGFESRFGSAFGCLIDTQTGEVIPLQRRGNLYVLKAWIRAAPFGRQGGKR
jgi:hypothetical protein